jgi:hypothetical protein
MQDERLRLEPLQLRGRRVDEERLGEERVPRALRDHAHAEPVRGIGACERVDHVHVGLAEPRRELRPKLLEGVLRDLRVDLTPPDPLLGTGLADDELVLRRAAGMAAGVDDEGAFLGEDAVAGEDRMGVQQGRRRAQMDAAGDADAVTGEVRAAPRLERRGHRGVS